jgi:hypothetical protein
MAQGATGNYLEEVNGMTLVLHDLLAEEQGRCSPRSREGRHARASMVSVAMEVEELSVAPWCRRWRSRA